MTLHWNWSLAIGNISFLATKLRLDILRPSAAAKAADYDLEHFGNPLRDRGIWVWYCQRLGLDRFLDLADEVISSARQHEIKWPVRAFQRHLKDELTSRGGAK